jgi:hypothetical protein
MRVYSKEAAKARYGLLRPNLAHWLDYWLFLHADETHPIWSARPLGISGFAQLAIASADGKNRVSRGQLSHEVTRITRLTNSLQLFPLPPMTSPTNKNNEWEQPWQEWFKALESSTDTLIIETIIDNLAKDIAGNRLSGVAYWSRVLAAELGDRGYSKRYLLHAVQQYFTHSVLNSSEESPYQIAEDIYNALFSSQTHNYIVSAAVLPVRLTKEVRVALFAPESTVLPVVSRDSKDGQGVRLMKGIRCRVAACHPEEAAVRALEIFKEFTEHVRLRLYVRVLFDHEFSVFNVDTEVTTHVPLPQPFWRLSHHQRRFPRIPDDLEKVGLQLERSDAHALLATRWHLSQAFADWTESVHDAAAKIWQAIEVFTPPRRHRKGEPPLEETKIQTLSDLYLRLVPDELLELLGDKLRRQKDEMQRQHMLCNWVVWNRERMPIEDWLRAALSESSMSSYRHWRPLAPALLFGMMPHGLLRIAIELKKNPHSQRWMQDRLFSDLRLLYALRNQVVHHGSHVFSARFADYLARSGVEILLAALQHVSYLTRVIQAAQSPATPLSLQSVLAQTAPTYKLALETAK